MLPDLWQHKKELKKKIMEVYFPPQTLDDREHHCKEERERSDRVCNLRRRKQKGGVRENDGDQEGQDYRGSWTM